MKDRRVRDFYTLSKNTYEDFNRYINENNLNKSKLLESLIKDFLEKNKL